MKRYISCMSKTRSEVRDSLENLAVPCMTHLAKIWLFPNSEMQHHWKREVWSFYSEIDRMKPKNRIPSAQFIYDCSWGIKNHLKEKTVQRAIDLEYENTPDIDRLNDLNTLYSNMEKYFLWVSKTLHEDELINLNQVLYELEELGM